MKPPRWTNTYPHGTKEGDEELKFFIALARNPKYQWRSTSAIAKEAGITKERVEEIINKYYKKGMVFQNPRNEDQWGYWERVPEMLPKMQKSISQKDQDDRINKLSKSCGDGDQCCGGSCSSDPACSKVGSWLKSDARKIFYVDVGGSFFDATTFMQNLKEQFRKKKEEKAFYAEQSERWHAPTTDEDIWIPIRPAQTAIMTEEDYLNKESERAWELDM